jgi:hypothetical protein
MMLQTTDQPTVYVIDITGLAVSDTGRGTYTFCPLDDATGEIITGMTMTAAQPPGPVVGVFSDDGQEHVEAWGAANPEVVPAFAAQAAAVQSDN